MMPTPKNSLKILLFLTLPFLGFFQPSISSKNRGTFFLIPDFNNPEFIRKFGVPSGSLTPNYFKRIEALKNFRLHNKNSLFWNFGPHFHHREPLVWRDSGKFMARLAEQINYDLITLQPEDLQEGPFEKGLTFSEFHLPILYSPYLDRKKNPGINPVLIFSVGGVRCLILSHLEGSSFLNDPFQSEGKPENFHLTQTLKNLSDSQVNILHCTPDEFEKLKTKPEFYRSFALVLTLGDPLDLEPPGQDYFGKTLFVKIPSAYSPLWVYEISIQDNQVTRWAAKNIPFSKSSPEWKNDLVKKFHSLEKENRMTIPYPLDPPALRQILLEEINGDLILSKKGFFKKIREGTQIFPALLGELTSDSEDLYQIHLDLFTLQSALKKGELKFLPSEKTWDETWKIDPLLEKNQSHQEPSPLLSVTIQGGELFNLLFPDFSPKFRLRESISELLFKSLRGNFQKGAPPADY